MAGHDNKALKPARQIRSGMGYDYEDFYCPKCGIFLAPEPAGKDFAKKNRCCFNCGQKIDWTEVGE